MDRADAQRIRARLREAGRVRLSSCPVLFGNLKVTCGGEVPRVPCREGDDQGASQGDPHVGQAAEVTSVVQRANSCRCFVATSLG